MLFRLFAGACLPPFALVANGGKLPAPKGLRGLVRHTNKNRSDDGKMTTCRNALRRVTESRIGLIV